MHSHIYEIVVHGAEENNLKNITLSIPKEKLVVVTGLAGSGKSSLVFDTLQRECQRQYMESIGLSAEHLTKPRVDRIEGLTPSISIGQFKYNSSPRSTVGTITEIYAYFRLLFAKLGVRPCPKCGASIQAQIQLDEDFDIYEEEDAAQTDTEESQQDSDWDTRYQVCSNCGAQVPALSMSKFSFNRPYGACPRCQGMGFTSEINIESLIDQKKSVGNWIELFAFGADERHTFGG